MKRISFAFCAAMALSSTQATALEVTNLDKVEHTIQIDSAGSKTVSTIPPGRTENFAGQPNALLTLLSAPKPSKGNGVVQSDGILSGIIGNGRTASIPAEDRDSFVIWPGGEINLQQRRRGGRQGR